MAGFSIVVVFLFFLAIAAANVLYLIVRYVLESISILCMAKNRNDKHPFAAWIPFYNQYMLGKIAGSKGIGMLSCGLSLVSILLGVYVYVHQELETGIFLLFLLSFFAVFILDTILAHKIFKSRTSKYGGLLTVCNLLSCGLLRPVFLFLLRNRPITEKSPYV